MPLTLLALICHCLCAGTYTSSFGSSTCLSCLSLPAGSYCPAGSTSAAGSQCPAGYHCAGGTADKQACPAGKYSASLGATSASACPDCEPGKFAGSGASDCTKCGAGKFSSSWGAESEATCIECPENTFSSALGERGIYTCNTCPAGKTAPSGSAENTDCISPSTAASASTGAHEARIVLSLPMSPSAFTDDKQAAFKSSLAQAAGVSSEEVVIHRIESMSSRRHLLAEAIRVETGIMTTDADAAAAIAGRLTADSINKELSKAGLPAATVLEVATPALASSNTLALELPASKEETGDNEVSSSSSFFSTPVLVGGSLGLVIVLGIVACFCHWRYKNRSTATSIPPLSSEIVFAGGINFAETFPEVEVHTGARTRAHAESCIVHDVEPASAHPLEEIHVEASLHNECVVCLSGEPVMALMPCGHGCACTECGPLLQTCPLCRTAVQEAKRIFG